MKIITVSPKGQITIPKKMREKCKFNKYAMMTKGNSILLTPIKISMDPNLEDFKKDGMLNMAKAWDTDEDAVWDEFFEKKD